jgi:HTH-type transcriptional regulator, cell division transcriptional repressor
MNLFGKLIRRGRLDRKLTQQKLSEKVDCSTEHIARIEIGTSLPSVKLLEKVFDELGIEPFKEIILTQDPKKHSLISQLISEVESLSVSDIRLIVKISRIIKNR